MRICILADTARFCSKSTRICIGSHWPLTYLRRVFTWCPWDSRGLQEIVHDHALDSSWDDLPLPDNRTCHGLIPCWVLSMGGLALKNGFEKWSYTPAVLLLLLRRRFGSNIIVHTPVMARASRAINGGFSRCSMSMRIFDRPWRSSV